MKQFCKRSCSLLLVLAVLLALCPTSLLTVSAASTNTGTRHEVCEELSSKATAYYTGNYTYDAMASLTPGNESCLDTVDSAMYKRLQTLMDSTMTKSVGYSSLIDYWPDTDCTATTSQAQLFYSDVPSSSYNREHVWPKSRASFLKTNGGCDLHHLRPTDTTINSTRSNFTMGNVRELLSSYSTKSYDGETVLYYDSSYKADGISVGLVEVNDNIKGDVARILLYVYVRWGEPNLFENDPNPVVGSDDDANNGYKVMHDLATLLEWCEIDPVDTWEMSRNDSIQGVQGNRNVFIDYPEFAWLLFGQEVPSGMTTPSGNSSVSYEINAISNNTSYGTVAVSGRTITAYPKEGYYAAGYTVLSGTATVTQDGNTFIVDAQTGCAIRINFAAKTAVTVSFNGAADPISGYAGEAITLPYISNPDGYRFVGWVESAISDTTEKPAFYAAGSSYTPTKSMTLYALYQHSDGDSSVGEWTRIMSTDELRSGLEVIIASSANGVAAGDIATAYLADVVATFSADYSVLENPDDNVVVFTLGGEEGAWTLTDAEGQVLGATAAKKLGWGTGTMTWDITVENGDASIYSGNSSYGRILYNNNSPRFTTYTNAVSAMLSLPQLYSGNSGTIFYTTELVSCEHGASAYHEAVAATCTQNGNSAYYTCNSCGRYFSDAACTNQIALADTVIDAFGHTEGKYSSDETYHWHLCATCGVSLDDNETHDWDDGVVTVQPTETQTGLRVYTCTICSATKNESIAALGAKLYLSFTVPAGLTAPATLSGYKGDKVILPDYSAAPAEGYTFLGWISETVTDSTSVGSYYKAGASYTLNANATLKALYTYQVEGDEGTGEWRLLESDSALRAGMQLVMASNTKGVTAGAHSSSYLDEVASVFSDDLTVLETLGDGTVIITLGGEADAWTLSDVEGQLLGASANKNVKWGSGTTTWKITINEGAATIQNTNSSYGRFLYNVSATRFTTYTSATSTSMLLPQLYALDGKAAITYYTTEYATVPTEPTVDESIIIYHTLDLASDISITFAVPKTALANYDSYYLECVLPEFEGNVQTGTTTVKVEPVLNGSYYYFTLTGITAVRMGDMVDAVLHMTKDGAEYISKTDSYSVATYAYAMMAKSVDAYMLTLCADLLRYGAEAQQFKKYRTDALVDAAMTDAQRAYCSNTDALTFTATDSYLGDLASPAITWVGKTLDLGSKVGMKFVFNAKNYSGDVTDLSMKVSYIGSTGEVKTVTLTGIEVYSSANSYYSFTFYGLLASELRTVVEVAIYEGNTQLSESLRYSAESYATKTAGTTLEALTKALFAYSDSAKAFFAK